jgi:hypothetical protein
MIKKSKEWKFSWLWGLKNLVFNLMTNPKPHKTIMNEKSSVENFNGWV